MTRPPVPPALDATRLVAILRLRDARQASEIATALHAGGVRALELTLNSGDALAALRTLARSSSPNLLLGAGTVLEEAAGWAAVDAGARFLVCPHTAPAMIEAFASRGVPVIAGALSPTEVLAAWQAGAALVKLFPAGTQGPQYVRELRGPFPEIPLLPTGGVTLENASAFLEAGSWGLGVGSSLIDPALLAGPDFAAITQRARAFLDVTVSRVAPE